MQYQLKPRAPALPAGSSYWPDATETADLFATHWPNFTPEEIASNRSHRIVEPTTVQGFSLTPGDTLLGSGAVVICPKALDALQALRENFTRPLHVNSGFRDVEYNRVIGGEPNSQHLLGQAFDIAHAGFTSDLWISWIETAETAGFTGFGLYNTFAHVDIGPKRWWDLRSSRTYSKDLTEILAKARGGNK